MNNECKCTEHVTSQISIKDSFKIIFIIANHLAVHYNLLHICHKAFTLKERSKKLFLGLSVWVVIKSPKRFSENTNLMFIWHIIFS